MTSMATTASAASAGACQVVGEEERHDVDEARQRGLDETAPAADRVGEGEGVPAEQFARRARFRLAHAGVRSS